MMAVTTWKRPALFFAALLALAALFSLAAPAFAGSGGVAEYTIKPGDTLTRIAKQYGLTLDLLLAANPQISDPSRLRAGEVIFLPPGRSEGVLDSGPRRLLFWEIEKNGGRVVKTDHLYRIRSGDNFYRVAQRFGLTFDDLVAANPQTTAGFLYRGELIHIPIDKLGEGNYWSLFYETPGGPGSISQ
jgi:LysM repeat protein